MNRVIRSFVAYNNAAVSAASRVLALMPRFGNAAFKGATQPAKSAPYFGPYFVAGTTTTLGEPVGRRVDLIHQRSGTLVARQYTGADGVFLFDNVAEGPWTVLGTDVSAEQNSVVYAHVVAEKMV